MSAGAGGGEKTEKPTQKKLKDSRKEGRIARSQDVGTWLAILTATMIFPLSARLTWQYLQPVLRGLTTIMRNPEPTRAVTLLGKGLMAVAIGSAPLGVGLLLVGVAATAVQGGVYPATKSLKPQFSRVNPISGLKRLFGMHTLWEATKISIKTGVLALVVWTLLKKLMPGLVTAGALPLASLGSIVLDTIITMMRLVAVAGLVVSVADYVFVKRKMNKQLKMSKQEVKEENRQSEGDPQMKSAIRSKQFAMSRNRMMSQVSQADVVVVNPIHVAVALKYDPERGAPRVIAKGAGAVAAKIREKAHEHRVPLVEDVPLARTLYRNCELGDEVPSELYMAVARILAFVLSLKSRGSAAGFHRPTFNAA